MSYKESRRQFSMIGITLNIVNLFSRYQLRLETPKRIRDWGGGGGLLKLANLKATSAEGVRNST